jgi:gp16 family phage-associated protein
MQSYQIMPEQIARVKELFLTNGKTYTEWAQENNVDRNVVYAVLNGRSRCLRGEGHKIAVLLGLKTQNLVPLNHVLISQTPTALIHSSSNLQEAKATTQKG